jgi:cytochrome c oxidase subunit 1
MQMAFPGHNVPGYGVVSPGEYNTLITNHGTIMIFWLAMPVLVAAFGNYLIPLMLGCDDMVFPRLNRLSYQIFLISAIVLIASWFVEGGGFGGAWTAYPPLSSKSQYNLTPLGSTLWVIAVALEFVAFLLGGINFVTTAMNSRAPGMKMFDMPMIAELNTTSTKALNVIFIRYSQWVPSFSRSSEFGLFHTQIFHARSKFLRAASP